MTVRILPKFHSENFPGILKPVQIRPDYLWETRDSLFFVNGKGAIHYLVNKYALTRCDEVCIFTSTDSSYVSTCVSATIFNYAKISRVMTEKTRLVYVIHEFGMPFQGISTLAGFCKEKNIPLVEDCALAMDSEIHGKRIGTFGDYAIYSLSKVFPIDEGGVLVGASLPRDNDFFSDVIDARVRVKFSGYLPYLKPLSERRKYSFKVIRECLPNLEVIFEFCDCLTPSFVIFKTEKYQEIYDALRDAGIECGLTHVRNWLCVPTQPLMTAEELTDILEVLIPYGRD